MADAGQQIVTIAAILDEDATLIEETEREMQELMAKEILMEEPTSVVSADKSGPPPGMEENEALAEAA